MQATAFGTAAGNMAIVKKQLARLGIATWEDMADAFKYLWVKIIDRLDRDGSEIREYNVYENEPHNQQNQRHSTKNSTHQRLNEQST